MKALAAPRLPLARPGLHCRALARPGLHCQALVRPGLHCRALAVCMNASPLLIRDVSQLETSAAPMAFSRPTTLSERKTRSSPVALCPRGESLSYKVGSVCPAGDGHSQREELLQSSLFIEVSQGLLASAQIDLLWGFLSPGLDMAPWAVSHTLRT